MARSNRLAAVGFLIAAIGCTDGQVGSTGGSGPVGSDMSALRMQLRDPAVSTKLRALSLDLASQAGVSSPKTMHAVAASDHQQAESLISGAIVDGNDPVYVVQMTGGPFTAWHHPPHVEAPQGDVLTLTIDAATHEVLDIGFDALAPDLTAIDSVLVDLLTP